MYPALWFFIILFVLCIIWKVYGITHFFLTMKWINNIKWPMPQCEFYLFPHPYLFVWLFPWCGKIHTSLGLSYLLVFTFMPLPSKCVFSFQMCHTWNFYQDLATHIFLFLGVIVGFMVELILGLQIAKVLFV